MHGLEIKEHIIFFVSLSIQYAYTIVYIYIYRIIYEIYMHTQRKAILPDQQVLRDTARLS